MAFPTEGGSKVTAVAGGGGGGGLIVYLATTFLDPPLRDIAIYLTPTAGIFIGSAFSLAEAKIKERRADQIIRAELAKAKERLSRIESDPNATEEHKTTTRQKAEALERAAMQIHDRRIKKAIGDR